MSGLKEPSHSATVCLRSELQDLSLVSHGKSSSSHRRLSLSATLYPLGIQRYTSSKSPAIEMKAHFRAIARSRGLLALPLPNTYDSVILSPSTKCRFPCPSLLPRTRCLATNNELRLLSNESARVRLGHDHNRQETKGKAKEVFWHDFPLSSNHFVWHICEC